MSGFESKKMMAESRDPKLPFQDYMDALYDATVAFADEESKPTQTQSLIWLQGLMNMWIRQSEENKLIAELDEIAKLVDTN